MTVTIWETAARLPGSSRDLMAVKARWARTGRRMMIEHSTPQDLSNASVITALASLSSLTSPRSKKSLLYSVALVH